MSRYFYPVRWISVQVDRFLHTNSVSGFIYPAHVRNQNRVGVKTSTQKSAQDDQRGQFRDRYSVLNPPHLARQPATKRHHQSSKARRLFGDHTEPAFIRSTRHAGRGAFGARTKKSQRFFQRNFRDHCQTSQIAFEVWDER